MLKFVDRPQSLPLCNSKRAKESKESQESKRKNERVKKSD